jgi:HAD superfamily hydrolase (TIGR01484 family)
MYKALITDLDGTAIPVTSDGSEVTDSTRAAISEATHRGLKIACATGRHWEIAESVIRSLELVAPCIIESGTRIVRAASGETLWEKPLSHGVAAQVLDMFKSIAPTGFYMSSQNRYRHPLVSVASVPDNIRFMYLVAIPEASAIKLQNQINAHGSVVAHITPSWDGGGLIDLHVTHPEGTKEYAMKVWQEMQGITQAETVGMGDSGNDVPIFMASGLKVAVGNATSEIKELADYITPNAADNALEHVINKFLLKK